MEFIHNLWSFWTIKATLCVCALFGNRRQSHHNTCWSESASMLHFVTGLLWWRVQGDLTDCWCKCVCVCVKLVTVCLFLLRVSFQSHSFPPPHPSFFPLIPLWPPAECPVGGSHIYRQTHTDTHRQKHTVSPPLAADSSRSLSLSHTPQGGEKRGMTGKEDDRGGKAGWGGRQNRRSGQLSSVKPLSTCPSATLWECMSFSVTGGWSLSQCDKMKCWTKLQSKRNNYTAGERKNKNILVVG